MKNDIAEIFVVTAQSPTFSPLLTMEPNIRVHVVSPWPNFGNIIDRDTVDGWHLQTSFEADDVDSEVFTYELRKLMPYFSGAMSPGMLKNVSLRVEAVRGCEVEDMKAEWSCVRVGESRDCSSDIIIVDDTPVKKVSARASDNIGVSNDDDMPSKYYSEIFALLEKMSLSTPEVLVTVEYSHSLLPLSHIVRTHLQCRIDPNTGDLSFPN